MSESNLLKDWLKKNGYKLKIAYSYSIVNRLNIESKEDVLKILEVTDSEYANGEQAEIYSKMLQLFRAKFRKTAEGSLHD